MKFPPRSFAYLAANPFVSLVAWVRSSYPTRPIRLVAAVVAVAALSTVPGFPQSAAQVRSAIMEAQAADIVGG